MKLLIVDDSKVMRLMVSRTLRQAGFTFDIVEAQSGVEAYDVYRKDLPGLVLSGWNMPQMTGMELLEKLVAIDPNVRFGFVTSEQTLDARERATKAGARFLISKPFTPEAFKQHIESAFRG